MAEKNKVLKREKREREQEKIEEEQLWNKLKTLNKEFRAIGNTKKQQTKKSKGNIKINCSINFEIFNYYNKRVVI